MGGGGAAFAEVFAGRGSGPYEASVGAAAITGCSLDHAAPAHRGDGYRGSHVYKVFDGHECELDECVTVVAPSGDDRLFAGVEGPPVAINPSSSVPPAGGRPPS